MSEVHRGIRSLVGWRKGVRQKKTETHRKIVGGSRKACLERFIEGIGKLAGNAKGDHQKDDRRTYHKIVEGYRSMREIRVAGSSFQ
ncbi:hypothetical protein GW17_00056747 [Ensete ventricosum]|uniref:Uncharacterized protein n=1 Tax=Ensete ventricosum TaxID=4639 RepID=A0A444C7G2_ENSVE|nr:hypothetical protein GW17_00056747 [Ensete ventricosum]RZR70925.1 hypothetical protein BHM03_00002334 [Ensete ventricosum]